jgi:hypothetical protein
MPCLDTHKERFNILKPLKNSKNVVIGSFSFNRQMKYPLIQAKLPLTDIDIKSHKPKKLALAIERSLDKSVGFNNYYISVLKHDNGKTFRIHSRARNTVVADISLKNKKIPFRTINNVKYETIAHRKQQIKKMLSNPTAKYRREKDQRMMGYIDRYYDSDNDGVPNWRDCKPFDNTRTGIFHTIAYKFRNLGSAGNVQKRKEYLQQQYIQHGLRGSPSTYRPQNYHVFTDKIESRQELIRRLQEERIKDLMQQNLTAIEANDIVENEIHPDFEKYAHGWYGVIYRKYQPLTKNLLFSHWPNRS